MIIEDLLNRILSATTPEQVLTPNNYRKEYLAYVKQIHPDICGLTGASAAMEKLNGFKQQLEQRNSGEDDAGAWHKADDKTLVFKGERTVLAKSLENYARLMRLTDGASRHFQQYLPASITFENDYLYVRYPHRLVPLTHVTLPQEHVSWVLSRLLELVAWLHQTGYCHAGINPEAICIVPETHGIVCVSFYHMQGLNARLDTISGRYLDWYPQLVFNRKQALPYVDLSLAQRTALYLLGDKSGNGVKLKKDCNEQLIDFLITPHYDAYQTYDDYRQLLRAIFGKPTFHELKL